MLKVVSLQQARTMIDWILARIQKMPVHTDSPAICDASPAAAAMPDICRSGQGTVCRTESMDMPLLDALGCRLSSDIMAPADVPAFDRSTVDGYAVHASDTFGAGESLPAMIPCDGEIHMGQPEIKPLLPGNCRMIPTGGQLPPGSDAVVMLEDVDRISRHLCCMNRPVAPGAHVLYRGDDIRAGEPLLLRDTWLHAQDLAAIAALGIARIPAYRPAVTKAGLKSLSDQAAGTDVPAGLHQPGTPQGLQQPGLQDRLVSVAVLSTGDELAEPGTHLSPGRVYDSNSIMLQAIVRQAGARASFCGIIPDSPGPIAEAVQHASRTFDLVLISGGSSAGTRDHVAEAIMHAGQPGLLLHGIAVKPGKPTIIGLADNVPIIGLPGHPLAAWFMSMILVVPLLYGLQGMEQPVRPCIEAYLASRIPSNHGREELVPVTVYRNQENGKRYAKPLQAKSGLIASLTRCQGYLSVPRDCEGIPEDTAVTVYLMRSEDAICHI